MIDPRPHLRDLAVWAQLTHAAVGLRGLGAGGASAVMAARGELELPAWVSWLNLGLAMVVAAAAAAAARHAWRAGLARSAQHVWGALLIWAAVVVVSIASAREDVRVFVAPAAVATDLACIAWCLMLGAAVRHAGAADAGWLRALAVGWLVASALVRMAPLPVLMSVGTTAVVAIGVAAVIVPFGAASVDAFRLWRATRDAHHAMAAQADDAATGDDPWRP